MKRIIILFLSLALLVSCGKKDTYLEEFNRVMEESQGSELLPALEDLDSKYPEKLRTKVNIAALHMSEGETEQAEAILNEALPLAEKSADPDDKYYFYTNYSEFLYQKGQTAESIKAGKKALENNGDDPYGVSLTLAQALAADKKYSEALPLFSKAWATNINLFTDEDLAAFLSLLGISQDAEKNIGTMVSVIDEMRARNPALKGTGLRQAELLEQAGAHVSSLIAVFSELEHSRYNGDMDNYGAEKTLEMIAESLEENRNESTDLSLGIIEAYKSFIREEWSVAEAAFAGIQPEVPISFYSYLRFASMLQNGQGNDEIMTGFALLERYYSGIQGYYYHMWNGIRKGAVQVENDVLSNIMKNCILQSPDSQYASESRVELGKLHGIENGKDIVLVDEVFHHINSVIEGSSPEILEKTAVMLEMEDNVFVEDALTLLREAFRNETISQWFQARAEKGNTLIKKRIESILS